MKKLKNIILLLIASLSFISVHVFAETKWEGQCICGVHGQRVTVDCISESCKEACDNYGKGKISLSVIDGQCIKAEGNNSSSNNGSSNTYGTCKCNIRGGYIDIDCTSDKQTCKDVCYPGYSVGGNCVVEKNNATVDANDGKKTIGCAVFSKYTSAATKLIMIAAPILLLILTTVDLMGAVSAGDEKDMKKSINTLVKRFVICLIILILPTIINIIVGWTVFDNFTACIGG